MSLGPTYHRETTSLASNPFLTGSLALCLVPAGVSAIASPSRPGASTNEPDIFACEADNILIGQEALDHLGLSLSACGDWDDSGVLDILAGAAYPWDKATGNPHPGKVQLFLGSTATGCDNTPDLLIEGTVEQTLNGSQGEVFGWSVAFIGDLDDDDKSDFAVGAPRGPYELEDNSELDWNERGRVYIFLSSMYPASGSSCTALSANLIIEGVGFNDRFGNSIAEIGDFDGDGQPDFDWGGGPGGAPDGIPDLIIGAPGGQRSMDDYNGSVYVISGADIAAHAVTTTDCSSAHGPTSGQVVQLGTGTGEIDPLATWTGRTVAVPPETEESETASAIRSPSPARSGTRTGTPTSSSARRSSSACRRRSRRAPGARGTSGC